MNKYFLILIIGLISSTVSSFNLLGLKITNNMIIFSERSFWGLSKKNEIKYLHQDVYNQIDISNKLVMVKYGRKVKYHSLEVKDLGDQINKKIFSIYKSKDLDEVVSKKEEIKKSLDAKNEYSKVHIFLFPFLIVGLIFCVIGFVGICRSKG